MGRVHLSGGSRLYDTDPTYFPRGRVKRPLSRSEQRYLRSLSKTELAEHLAVRNYPSGRPSYGGANRSSNIKREIGLKVIRPSRCGECGGVTEAVASLTTLFPVCRCGPLISTLL